MLSNQATHSLVKRLAVAAFAATFVLIGFAPVRLAAYETDGTEMHGNQRVSGKPSPMGYMLKMAGQKGTRGSIDVPADLAAARSLDRWNRTALYFRFGEERWITYDAQAIAEARKAFAEEDQFDAQDQARDKAEQALDRDEQQIESRWEQLQGRRDALHDRKSELEDQWQQRKEDGKSTDSIEAERDRIERQMDDMSRSFDEISRSREALSKRRKDFETMDKRNEAARDVVERRTMAEIQRIGRRAISRGVAESYGAGGSSADSPRNGTFRFFLPPEGQIW